MQVDIRDLGLIPGSGRSPGGVNGYSLQNSCLENPMDRGTWQAAVHRVTRNRTQLKQLSTHTQMSVHGDGGLVAKLCLTLAIPWTLACQSPLSMGFSRQEYWSGWPFPPPVDLPDQGIEPTSLMSLALAGGFFTTSTTWEACRAMVDALNSWVVVSACIVSDLFSFSPCYHWLHLVTINVYASSNYTASGKCSK